MPQVAGRQRPLSTTMANRVIFHLDMDAFYAAIEQRDQPALRGQPVIVGSPPSQRGVVCAASYEARRYGVRSAMPSSIAGRLCPKGVFVPVRMARYKEESSQIMTLLGQTGGVLEQMSIDEAYLDLSNRFTDGDADRMLYKSLDLARTIKRQIRTERGLTASIGIATNKFLAKLASDFQKPDGLTLVPELDKVLFLRSLPVRVIHGVGPVTERELLQAGIQTISDLQDSSSDLRRIVGSFADKLRQFAFGEDTRPVENSDEVKSISSEETFLKDTEDRIILRRCLREQADEISNKLQRRGLGAHTVQVKVRYSDFTTLTRQISLEEPVTGARAIYRLGCFLLARDRLVSRPLRLLGLGVSTLGEPISVQLQLFDHAQSGALLQTPPNRL